MSNNLPKRQLGKSTFSMYLRSKCDRSLYLSLFSNNPTALKKAEIPIPLKSRPGVQLITKSGQEFENDQFDQLILAFPDNVIHKSNGRSKIDLVEALSKAKDLSFILQPQIEPESFKNDFLQAIGVASENFSNIPKLSGLRPDIIYVSEAGSANYEILANGSRKKVSKEDPRSPLSIIDLKNIKEANASYSAEVCLYAVFLSNWLKQQNESISKKFFVSDQVYLWKHLEMPNFTKIQSVTAGGDFANKLNALLLDLEDGKVNYIVFMPSVRKFFVEDIPRVVQKGDSDGWEEVEYHVNSKCNSCDWLGSDLWLSKKDKALLQEFPHHYCSHNAEKTDHLCKMPTLSKGATDVLRSGGHSKVKDLLEITPNEQTLKKHSLLKKDRSQISTRAEAITNDLPSIDSNAKIGGLARNFNAEYDIIINFDSSSGFLTGIALRAYILAPYGESFEIDGGEKKYHLLGEESFVVSKDNLMAEWATLNEFIETLAHWIEKTEQIFADNHLGNPKTQICFWDSRQYDELCKAFGRHLIEVLKLGDKNQKALAWIFPAEELMEKESEICPCIVFIKDIVNYAIQLPERYNITLLGTSEHYHHSKYKPRKIDSYYKEPLGDAIPRERIYDIWKSTTGTVQAYGKDISIAKAIDKYGSILKAHSFALASIISRIREDLKTTLTKNAPILKKTIPSGLQSVAYDSKLWNLWAKISCAADKAQAQASFLMRPEWLESSYKSIILDSLVTDHGDNSFTFRISDDSTEAKIEEGDSFCTLGMTDRPGLPLETPASLKLEGIYEHHYVPLYSIIKVEILEFDRANAQVQFKVKAKWSGVQDVFEKLIDEDGPVKIEKGTYLLEGLPYDDSNITKNILQAVGNPSCATIAKETRLALGKAATARLSNGTGKDSPIAKVLWKARELSNTAFRSKEKVDELVKNAVEISKCPLNTSQLSAASKCLSSRLSIMWGPPGTGKTNTLVSLLHSVIREKERKNILITGPNYRAVEELSGRLIENLNEDNKSNLDFYCVYSKNRKKAELSFEPEHFNLSSINLLPGSEEVEELIVSANDDTKTTVIATTAHILDKLVKQIDGEDVELSEIFDLIVMDESSQIPVVTALRPLAALKENSQLIIAGDHLQMPPINSLEPPAGAEYLVSSIQGYLIKRFEIPQEQLLLNYRSNQQLVDYACSLGYPSELKAQNEKKQLKSIVPLNEIIKNLPDGLPLSDSFKELLNPENSVTTLIYEDSTSSQANEMESLLVASLAYCIKNSMAKELYTGEDIEFSSLTDEEFFKFGIGIVTPHKAQKALVIQGLKSLFPEVDPEIVYNSVDTVERFQGGERQTIIISYGVGDTDIIEGEEEFLLQMERTNVAVSRAMAKSIMILPKSLAYHLPTTQKASDTSVAIKSYVEEFCNAKKTTKIIYDNKEIEAEVRWHQKSLA